VKSKTLALALILVVLGVLAPVTYVIATTNTNASTEEIKDEDWFDEMKAHMEDHLEVSEELKEHIEDHLEEMEEFRDQTKLDQEDEDWFDEMKEHMEDTIGSHDHHDDHHDSRNSRHGCH
jgi:Skp family chaperone for outer membrane proteins